MKRSIVFLLVASAAGGSQASDTFSYDHINVFYQHLEIDNTVTVDSGNTIVVTGLNGEGAAYGLRGAWSVNDTWFLGGEWRRRDYDHEVISLEFGQEQDVVQFDVGGHWRVGDATDFVLRAGVVRAEDSAELDDESLDAETSYRLLIGLRHAFSDRFELYANAGQTGLDETNGFVDPSTGDSEGLLADIGLTFAMNDRWSLLLEGSRSGDFDEYGLALRYAL